MHPKGKGVLSKYRSQLSHLNIFGLPFLIEEVLREDPYTFIKIASAALDVGPKIAASGPPAEDNPFLEVPSNEKGKGSSYSFSKPPRAPRSKRRKI